MRAACWRRANWSVKVLTAHRSNPGTGDARIVEGNAVTIRGPPVTKTDVRIIDFVDTGHPALLRMWDNRQRGYRAMGYRFGE